METKIDVTRENFSIICRICLFPNELLPIESTHKEIFKEITNIEVKENDGLPKHICKMCIKLLEEIERFIQQSKDNYSLLKALDNKENNEHPEIVSRTETVKLELFDQDVSFSGSETETKEHINEGDLCPCPQCDMRFSDNVLLVSHFNKLHGGTEEGAKDSVYKCSTCTKVFESDIALLRHKKFHFKRKRRKAKIFKYGCTECDRIVTSQSALDNHMKTHTGDRPYKCFYCNKDFAFSGNLTVHIRTHTGETPFTCKICDKSYCSSGSLKKHNENHHFDDRKIDKNCVLEDLEKVKCKICKKMLSKHGYGTHMRMHTNERKEFICLFCSKHFKKASHLDRHVRIHTGERPYVCNLCKKPFTQEGDLKRHWLIHSGQKEYQCQHCGKLYYTKSALDTHLVVHTGKKKALNNCDTCKKSVDQCDKTSHATVTEERPFLCTICGKSFTAGNSLKVHLRLHSGECPYVCTYCDKRYTNASNLKRHIMTNHTLEKPHVCMICHKGFHDSTNLKRHVNRVHSVLEIRGSPDGSKENVSSS